MTQPTLRPARPEDAQNLAALAFYEKHGFAMRGAFDFELGDERHRNLVLARLGG